MWSMPPCNVFTPPNDQSYSSWLPVGSVIPVPLPLSVHVEPALALRLMCSVTFLRFPCWPVPAAQPPTAPVLNGEQKVPPLVAVCHRAYIRPLLLVSLAIRRPGLAPLKGVSEPGDWSTVKFGGAALSDAAT